MPNREVDYFESRNRSQLLYPSCSFYYGVKVLKWHFTELDFGRGRDEYQWITVPSPAQPNPTQPSPTQPRTIITDGELLDQIPAVSHSIRILAYLWPQRCYWTESGPACRGPGTPLLCVCPCLRHSMSLSLRASWLYNRWKMLKEVFRRGPMHPGAETLRFGFGWT